MRLSSAGEWWAAPHESPTQCEWDGVVGAGSRAEPAILGCKSFDLSIEGEPCADQNVCRVIIPNGSSGETQACANCATRECCRTVSARGAISSKERRRPGSLRPLSIRSAPPPPAANSPHHPRG